MLAIWILMTLAAATSQSASPATNQLLSDTKEELSAKTDTKTDTMTDTMTDTDSERPGHHRHRGVPSSASGAPGMDAQLMKLEKDMEAFFSSAAKQVFIMAMIGLGIGTLIWLFVCKGRKRASHSVTKEDMAKGDFEAVGKFTCFLNCCEAYCCAEYLWAETAGKISFWGIPFVVWFIVVLIGNMASLLWIPMFTTAVVGSQIASAVAIAFSIFRVCARGNMRDTLNQGNTCTDLCKDILCHWCCAPCAVHQEAVMAELAEDLGMNKAPASEPA